jgi:hypothetical protein
MAFSKREDLRNRVTVAVARVDRDMLTRVERDGLSHRYLPYYQRWINLASVKYVRKTNLESFSLYRRKNYHDPLPSQCVANF